MSATHDLLVIGGASLDVLHLPDGHSVKSPGGAGMYTALAAAKAGARVSMFAPRPKPVPSELLPALDRIDWIGPIVPPDQLPRFEIAHHGGGRATLVDAFWGGEMLITPESLTPDHLTAPLVHIAALRTAERQLNFAKALAPAPTLARFSGAGVRISAGTYGKICTSEPDTVRAIMALADYFFMNENEATLIFGSLDRVQARPGQFLFVTLSANGALVFQGNHVTHVAGVPATEVDPTGAGDTFCGATLAGLARGQHPIMAARAAIALAADMIGGVGPTRLLSDAPAPPYPIDPRVAPVPDQIQRIATLIARLPDVQPFDFTGGLFPPVDHPGALDLFFTSTLQQFSFWNFNRADAPRAYGTPLIADFDGRALKGSDYLFAAYRRALDATATLLTPIGQRALTADQLAALFRADDGANPMPAFDLHLQQANAYGRDLLALNLTPSAIVEIANRAAHPRAALLSLLDHIGGYKDDPLRKKSMLLALILEQRPEKFLHAVTDEPQPPVIDYHLMRSCLRTGLIEISDVALRDQLIRREEVSAPDEWAIRLAAYAAIEQVQKQSGRSMGAVDWFFFNARRRCPEMTPPDCAACAIDAVCAHYVELFQPVRRTTFY
ncbi:MAG: PfkB family carbohydrate kinase [Anaerolineae bacterium]